MSDELDDAYWRGKEQDLLRRKDAGSSGSSGLGLQQALASQASPGLNVGGGGTVMDPRMDYTANAGLGAEEQVPQEATWIKALRGIGGAVEAFGAGVQGRTPLFMLQQQQDLQRAGVRERRQMMALQIRKAEQQQNQQHLENFLSLDKQLGADPEQWDQQMKMEAAKGNLHARIALGVGDKKMKGEYASVVPLVDTYFPEFAKKYAENPSSVGKAEMRAVLNNVSKIKDRRALADADASEYGALQKVFEQSQSTGTPMNMGDLERFQELHGAKTKKSLELEKLQADIALTKKKTQESEGGDKVTQTMNGLARGIFMKDAREIGANELVTPEDRTRIQQHGLSIPEGPISRLTALSALANVQVPTLVAGNRATAQQQAQLNVPDKPSPGERMNLIDDVGTLERIDSLHSLYSSKYVGPARGRIGAATELFGGITEDEADFRAENSTLKNQVIKMITGAQMSEPEAKRIMKQVPDPENPPTVYEARLKRTRENVYMMAQKRRQVLQASGIDVSHLPPLSIAPGSHPAIKNALDEVLSK